MGAGIAPITPVAVPYLKSNFPGGKRISHPFFVSACLAILSYFTFHGPKNVYILCLHFVKHNILLHFEAYSVTIPLSCLGSVGEFSCGDSGYVRSYWKGIPVRLVLIAISIVIFLALVTDGFDAAGSAGRPLDGMLDVPNLLRQPGAAIVGILAVLVGDAAHLVYAVILLWGFVLFTHFPFGWLSTRLMGMLLLVVAAAAMLHLNEIQGSLNAQPGGVFGAFIAEQLLFPRFGLIGSNVMGFIGILVGLLIATDFLFVHFLTILRRPCLFLMRSLWLGCRNSSRGVLWLFETQPPVALSQVSNTVAGSGRTEAATHEDTSTTRIQRGVVARVVSFLWPHISTKALPQDSDSLFPPEETGMNATAGTDRDTVKPLKRRKQIGPVPTRSINSGESHGSVPFGEIPEVDSRDARAGAYREAPPQGELFDSPVSEEGRAPSSHGEETDGGPDEADLPEVSEGGNRRVSLRQEGVADKLVTSKPGGPRLRRKIETEDELPEGYEYPEKYHRPSIDLFTRAERHIIPNLSEIMGKMADQLEETLRTFNLEAKVTDVTRGPTVTRFELEPAPGMKVNRFLALRDDIALALKAKGVRIEAPIPGKGRVGIEISNEMRDPVVIRELLEHPVFAGPGKGLDLALGKDITGEVCITDLTRMPHLLVAGATGAGKTVCIKALLASLLYHHTPDELQLMLVDPKMVELSIFNDIPHLITPVVTDPKKAAVALQWLITEMEERYRLFRDLRVRNIDVYNASVENGEIEMEGGKGHRKTQSLNVVRKLPYIVCIIDELADLMILARADVEEAIMRLAQLARAVGIHLIIATQRPSVDVLTGVIKANFPARISFQVSSRVDSRCILDEIGAENLVGLGDMLFMPAGQKPVRIQGAFVSDAEMLSLIAYLKRQAPPQYRDEIANFGKNKESALDSDPDDDPKLDEAIRVVLETGQASISMVQRRLRVGYTRAARLIDMMELKGIVGPHTGSKARDILVDSSGTDGLDVDFSDDEDDPEEDIPGEELSDEELPEEDETE